MKIRTQLIGSMVFFSIALLIISASAINTNRQVGRLDNQQDMVKNIELKVNELSYLSNDFLLYHESQQIDRWESQYSSISRDVSNLVVDMPDQQALVNNIKANQQRLKEVFGDIVSKVASSPQAQQNTVDPAFIQVSWSRIEVQTRGIAFDASRLWQMLEDEKDHVNRINYLLIIALLGTFGVFLLTNYFLIHRRTLKSISNLRAGTRIIGSGNLDFSVEEKKDDEIGELSHAFNRMTAQLKTVTASKKDLEREIAERKQAEEALRENEQKYRNLFDNAGDAIITIDLDARVTSWNQSAERIFGWMSGEAIGRKLDELIVPGEMQAEFKRNVQDTLEGKNITGVALVRQRKDGSRVDVSLTISAITDAEGKITGLSGIFRDITERKRAEEALQKAHDELELRVKERTAELSEANKTLLAEINERKQAEEKIREQATLLDNAQEAIGVRSLEHRLIYWNKGAQRLYGWTAEEALGKNPVEFLFKDKEEPPQLISAKKIVLEKGEWTGELRQQTKGGKEVIVESHWTLIYNSEGRPKSILVVNTDITEKKMFEVQLLRAQRMESIGILAGGIAHNLNNMLTPMMLSLQMLKAKFKDEESQKLLSILERNSQRGADLIKQVLSFARGVEGERKPFQITYIVSEIEKVLRQTFPRNIEIRTDLPGDIHTISGDATQLHQVIMNLCVNARDAMPDGGTLCISAENFFIDENYVRMHTEAKVGPYIVIVVSDTGTGIPPKILDRIFEPFFTTKEFGKGTGLGLSTALAIVKSHGGFINVYSEVGKGTKFSVYLPAIKTEMQNVEEQQPELLTGHGELVLVAEDEESIREVTISTLENNGYRVITASDGVEAISAYAQNMKEIKVILMDMVMPVMDGQSSIRAIRRINPEVKIIAVSGLAEKEKLAKIADTHVHSFLPKPYTSERLLKTIHEVLYAKV